MWSGFGGFCESAPAGDGTVRYDTLAGRWVITQVADIDSASGPYLECVAVSTSSDATGSYNRYSFQFTNGPDYQKTSVWPDAYYTTYNMYTPGPAGTFIDAEICAMTSLPVNQAHPGQRRQDGPAYLARLPARVREPPGQSR